MTIEDLIRALRSVDVTHVHSIEVSDDEGALILTVRIPTVDARGDDCTFNIVELGYALRELRDLNQVEMIVARYGLDKDRLLDALHAQIRARRGEQDAGDRD